MTPEKMGEYLRVARASGVQAFEVLAEGVMLRATLSPIAGLVAHRPSPGEAEKRLAEADPEILYGSSGGGL